MPAAGAGGTAPRAVPSQPRLAAAVALLPAGTKACRVGRSSPQPTRPWAQPLPRCRGHRESWGRGSRQGPPRRGLWARLLAWEEGTGRRHRLAFFLLVFGGVGCCGGGIGGCGGGVWHDTATCDREEEAHLQASREEGRGREEVKAMETEALEQACRRET